MEQKEIRMFFASSIVESAIVADREKIWDFIGTLNKLYRPHVFFSVVNPEDYDPAMVLGGKQAVYDRAIEQSDLAFFLFCRQVGDVTRHELFEVAWPHFEQHQKPKIFTFFRELPPGETIPDPIVKLKDDLGDQNGEYKHYYHHYSHIDTLKLHILLAINRLNLGVPPVVVVDNQATVNGESVLSLENVPMFLGNENLQALRREYDRLDEQFYPLQQQYLAKHNDMSLLSTYSDVAKQREKAKNDIREAERNILNLLDRMYKDTAKGKLSQRQRRAYALFEQGDYDQALRILDYDEIKAEADHNAQLAEKVKERLQVNVNELLQRIDALQAMAVTPERLQEIDTAYQEAVRLTKLHGLDRKAIYHYATFLYRQKQYTAGIKQGEYLKKWYELDESNCPSEAAHAYLWNLLALLYSNNNDFHQAEPLYREALDTYRKLAVQNPATYLPDIAGTCNNLANLYRNTHDFQQAEALYQEALEIRRKLAQQNPAAYLPDVATTCNNLAILYRNTHDFQKAEALYQEALEIRRKLAQQNPAAYLPDVATTCNNLAILYSDTHDFQKAEALYQEALDIYHKLAQQNPAAYLPDVATTCNNLANLYSDAHDFHQAEALYQEALEIRRKLAQQNPAAYLPDVATTCNNLANLYSNTHDFQKAESLYREALDTYHKLAQQNPAAYLPDVAMTCFNLALLYCN